MAYCTTDCCSLAMLTANQEDTLDHPLVVRQWSLLQVVQRFLGSKRRRAAAIDAKVGAGEAQIKQQTAASHLLHGIQANLQELLL